MPITNDMYPVGLAEDHDALRIAIQLLLGRSTNIEIVFVAKNGLEAIEGVIKHRPDVLVMDVHMPELDGLAATKQIVDLSLPTRVILMSSFEGRAIVRKARTDGAFGFVHKSNIVRSLPIAIETVYRGDYFFPEKQ